MNEDEVDAMNDAQLYQIYNTMAETFQNTNLDQNKDENEVYHFQAENQYLKEVVPLKTVDQNNTLAILALEAHLQQTPNDSNSWRKLGQLLQDNDLDDKAVSAFLNAYKYNPNDLGTLSSLGVSCINTLDEVRAMNYLKQWLMKNLNYKIKINDQIIPNNTIAANFSVQDLQRMNLQMIDVYQQAMQQNPNDIELISGLAVLFFIKRSFRDAVALFKKALVIEPNNYQIWNKLGATLAHLGVADQAKLCYHKALDLRPNYVRAWVNLAFTYAFYGQQTDAARLYLTALTLNPLAKHIWEYLERALLELSIDDLQLERNDLIPKIHQRDPSLFVNEFPITSTEEQPHHKYYKYIFKVPQEEEIKEFLEK